MILRLTPPLLLGLVITAAACSGDDDNKADPNDKADGGSSGNGSSSGGNGDGGVDPNVKRVVCPNTIPAASDGQLCDVTAGSLDKTLIQATILAGDTIYENGSVLVDRSDPNGKIMCVGCDCEAAGATVLSCAQGVLSPGLINAHDHMPYNANNAPIPHGDARYNHRHDWRRGKRGNQEIKTGGDNDDPQGRQFAEMRMLISGVTSLVGSGSAPNLVRNLDDSNADGNLKDGKVDYSTFPLADTSGTLRAEGCEYGKIEDETHLSARIYLPHVAEGIDAEARNEYACMTGGAVNTIASNTSIVHGIGLTAADIADVAARGAKLVWSPRTNIDLYGQTADVLTYRRLGVNIALGTDWIISGSMNMLRELKCVDSLNKTHYDNAFTDYEIWRMVTRNGAVAMGVEDRLGEIKKDYIADLALYDGSSSKDYRAVIDANVQHVAMVMRGGMPLYGDNNVISGLLSSDDAAGCEELDTCTRSKKVCAKLETGVELATLKDKAKPGGGAYDLFFCDTPKNEPSCVPFRKDEYTGVPTDGDKDGDGLPDGEDNCASHFNPRRPLENNQQPNFDADEFGDTCDVCPLNEGSTCQSVDPNDSDSDGIPNGSDNCPQVKNPDQKDSDGDGIGDACDRCPNEANPAGAACTATIQDIKQAVNWQVGDVVRVKGALVIGSGKDGVFLQAAGGGNYSGLFAFSRTAAGKPVQGDIIDVTGKISEFNGQIQIEALADINVVSQNNTLPAPTVVPTTDLAPAATRGKELEGTLVRVVDVTAGAFNAQFVEVTLNDGVLIDDTLFTYLVPPQGTGLDYVQGPLSFRFGAFRINPRSAADVVVDADAPRAVASMTPGNLTVPPAGTANLTVNLNLPAPAGGTVVNLSAAPAGLVTVPATVTIPEGGTSAQVVVTAVAASGNGTLSASVAGQAAPITSTFTVAVPVQACLIFSEYVEGTGNNKALEILNCSAAPIDLTGYLLCSARRNDLTVVGTVGAPLTGNIAANGVQVICNAAMDAANKGNCNVELPNIGTSPMQFNGNDSLYIVKDDGDNVCDPDDEVIDAFGPIEAAINNGGAWANVTYSRCDFSPYDGFALPFVPTASYKQFPVDTFSGLGTAPAPGCD